MIDYRKIERIAINLEKAVATGAKVPTPCLEAAGKDGDHGPDCDCEKCKGKKASLQKLIHMAREVRASRMSDAQKRSALMRIKRAAGSVLDGGANDNISLSQTKRRMTRGVSNNIPDANKALDELAGLSLGDVSEMYGISVPMSMVNKQVTMTKFSDLYRFCKTLLEKVMVKEKTGDVPQQDEAIPPAGDLPAGIDPIEDTGI